MRSHSKIARQKPSFPPHIYSTHQIHRTNYRFPDPGITNMMKALRHIKVTYLGFEIPMSTNRLHALKFIVTYLKLLLSLPFSLLISQSTSLHFLTNPSSHDFSTPESSRRFENMSSATWFEGLLTLEPHPVMKALWHMNVGLGSRCRQTVCSNPCFPFPWPGSRSSFKDCPTVTFLKNFHRSESWWTFSLEGSRESVMVVMLLGAGPSLSFPTKAPHSWIKKST